MLAILSLASIAFGAGLWVMVREIRRAPLGYQDATGFHRMPATQPETGTKVPSHGASSTPGLPNSEIGFPRGAGS
jgi:hypothetical protein